MKNNDLRISMVNIKSLVSSEYNPRKWSDEATQKLKDSITQFGIVDPILVNGADNRKNIVIGGHFRLKIAKDLGYKEVPVVYIDIPEIEREKELNLRLNKNVGEWDYSLLADFDASLLTDIGFSSEELDEVFNIELDAVSYTHLRRRRC